MQETILKNGRQYRSHPVYTFSKIHLSLRVYGSGLACCSAGPSSNLGSAPHGSSTPPTEPHLEDIEHFVSMTFLFFAKCIEKIIPYFSLLSCF